VIPKNESSSLVLEAKSKTIGKDELFKLSFSEHAPPNCAFVEFGK